MKIIIPILDQYIDFCQSKGQSALFENFTELNPDAISGIDSKIFETYVDYKNESRVISLLEYQSIKSYAQFLEEGDEEETGEPEEGDSDSNKLADMPEDEEEEVEDNEEEDEEEEDEEEGEDDDDEDEDDDDEDEDEFESKIQEAFKDLENTILKLGKPKKHSDDEGSELVGEDMLAEASEDTNLIIDFLFRRPRINKIIKKATDLKMKAVEAEEKVRKELEKRNDEMDQKVQKAKEKGVDVKRLKAVNRKKLSDLEDTLTKRVDAADDAAKDIEDEAEELAISNYLKRVLVKAKIESRIVVAQAKMQAASDEERAELDEEAKELDKVLREKEAELKQDEGQAKQASKDLGLSDDELEELQISRDEIEEIREKISELKKGDTEDPNVKSKITELQSELNDALSSHAEILDNVKDQEKQAAMYRSITKNKDVNNREELDAYIQSQEQDIKTVENPVKSFLDSEEGKGFSETKPADEELDQYETKAVKDAEGNEVTLYKKKEAAPEPPANPVKDFLASEEGKGFSETKPADEELDQYETKTVKDAEGNDVTLYKKKEAGPVTASVDNSIYESVAVRFRKMMSSKIK